MLNSNQSIIKHKLGLLNLAAELGNVSHACKVMGMSRDTFYRYQNAVESGGVEALFEKTRRKPNLPFYAEHDLPLLRILTDRGTEYCGRAERASDSIRPSCRNFIRRPSARRSISTWIPYRPIWTSGWCTTIQNERKIGRAHV